MAHRGSAAVGGGVTSQTTGRDSRHRLRPTHWRKTMSVCSRCKLPTAEADLIRFEEGGPQCKACVEDGLKGSPIKDEVLEVLREGRLVPEGTECLTFVKSDPTSGSLNWSFKTVPNEVDSPVQFDGLTVATTEGERVPVVSPGRVLYGISYKTTDGSRGHISLTSERLTRSFVGQKLRLGGEVESVRVVREIPSEEYGGPVEMVPLGEWSREQILACKDVNVRDEILAGRTYRGAEYVEMTGVTTLSAEEAEAARRARREARDAFEQGERVAEKYLADQGSLSMPPDLRLHQIASQLRDWLAGTDDGRGVPPVEIGYADDASWLSVGECRVWESENGGEIGELEDDGQGRRELTFENAVAAYKGWVANLARVLK